MSLAVTQPFGRLLAYLAVSYVLAAVVMSPWAGDVSEVLGFAAAVWALPAIIAIANRNEGSMAGQFRGSAISLIAAIALVWGVGLAFVMTY